MSSVDWRGVAMALGQLKDIAGPTELQKMQFRSDLAEGRAEDAREFAAKEKQKDRMFDAATKKFEYLQGRHEKLQTKVATKESNILGISAAFDTLKDEDISSGTGYRDATEDNELTPLQQTRQNITNIEEDVSDSIERLTYLTGAEKGMTFGKELRMTEGMAGAAIFKAAGVDATYDYDQSGYVSTEELEDGLEQSIMMMKEQGLPTIGVREGFWSEFKGESARTQDEIGAESDIISLARADIKLANELYESTGGKGDLNEAQIHEAYQEYYELQGQLLDYYDKDGKLTKLGLKNKTVASNLQKRVAELQISLAKEIGSDELDNTVDMRHFQDDQPWVKGGRKPGGEKTKDNMIWFDEYKQSPANFITEDKYNKYLHGKVVFKDSTGEPFTAAENMSMNMEMAKAMSFVMTNWAKYDDLRSSQKTLFDDYYNTIVEYAN